MVTTCPPFETMKGLLWQPNGVRGIDAQALRTGLTTGVLLSRGSEMIRQATGDASGPLWTVIRLP